FPASSFSLCHPDRSLRSGGTPASARAIQPTRERITPRAPPYAIIDSNEGPNAKRFRQKQLTPKKMKITIGLSLSLSGEYAAMGREAETSLRLFIADANASSSL